MAGDCSVVLCPCHPGGRSSSHPTGSAGEEVFSGLKRRQPEPLLVLLYWPDSAAQGAAGRQRVPRRLVGPAACLGALWTHPCAWPRAVPSPQPREVLRLLAMRLLPAPCTGQAPEVPLDPELSAPGRAGTWTDAAGSGQQHSWALPRAAALSAGGRARSTSLASRSQQQLGSVHSSPRRRWPRSLP